MQGRFSIGVVDGRPNNGFDEVTMILNVSLRHWQGPRSLSLWVQMLD